MSSSSKIRSLKFKPKYVEVDAIVFHGDAFSADDVKAWAAQFGDTFYSTDDLTPIEGTFGWTSPDHRILFKNPDERNALHMVVPFGSHSGRFAPPDSVIIRHYGGTYTYMPFVAFYSKYEQIT